jgi:transposase
MNRSQTIGIDTAKCIFFLHGESASGRVTLRQKLTRDRLIPFLANQPPSTIAIEAGCGVINGLEHSRSWVTKFA